jgi:hypothetical protein
MEPENDWVFVPNMNREHHVGPSERERPPQLKAANISSNQVADAGANDSSLLAAQLGAATLQEKSNLRPYLHVPAHNVAPSNSNDTDSTETSEATARLEKNATTATYAPTAHLYQSTSLTKADLERQQRELAAAGHGNINIWLEGPTPGYCKLAQPEYKGYPHAPRTDPSLASDASYEQVLCPTTDSRLELETRAAGAKFNDQHINPAVYDGNLDLSEA